jgi:hypothetical protein
LAEWIGENLQEELGFPNKSDKRSQPGFGWTPAELNHILHEHVVSGELITFGCVEWQSQLFRGTMRARCYPFDITDVLYSHTQDTVVIVLPYPYCIEEDHHDVALEDCWIARPQLFLKCCLRPKDGRVPKDSTNKACPRMYKYIPVHNSMYVFNNFTPDDLLLDLVFFNTFEEERKLPITGPMEDSGVVKLYKPSPTPCLYVAPVENMVGRVPLMPLFLAGNATPTFPHLYCKHKESDFLLGCADTAAADSMRGSSVFEVNPWLWQFGRGKPRLGGLSVEETAERKQAHRDESHKSAVETRRRRKADRT